MSVTIEVLLKLIIVLFIILFSFSIYLVMKRLLEQFYMKKKAEYLKDKQNEWYLYFRGKKEFSSLLIPNKKYEIEVIEEIFLAYLTNLSSSYIQHKIKRFSNQYLKQHYQKLLRNRKWSTRMNAMYRIADFQIDSLLYDCEKMERNKLSKEESFHLLKIYSILHKEKFINRFLTLSETFSEYEYKKLFMSVSDDILESLMDRIEDLPLPCQYSIVETIGGVRNVERLPFLEAQLNGSDGEMRIRALKAIHEIGIIINLEKYIPFVYSKVWEERLMMAKLLGNSSLVETLPYLEKLLQDESWWVRSQAAKTIGNGKKGSEILQAFIETATDKYAVDVAYEVLKKGRNNE